MIKVASLKKHFAINRKQTVHALDGVSFEIQDNEVLGLVGESGSGKSTLGKVLIGLHDKTEGQVFYKDQALPQQYQQHDFKKYASEMQMIFQDPYSSLNPRMTVQEIIAEGLKLKGGFSAQEIHEKSIYWLEKVGLNASHLARYPHEFSGGQRQRIGIARALIIEPKFIVCDEPISALDVSVQAQVVNLLAELKEEMGLTLLFIAHDLSMVRYVSDRMAVMYLGVIVEIGEVNDVFFRPKHPYTKFLIAANPEPDPKKERAKDKFTIQGEIPSPINLPKGCRFAGRCPDKMPRCEQEEPVLQSVDGGEAKVACFLF
ncbi:MAG: oligopeptide ABC transporter ATP-binding protein OppF [Gammaproteobacteria bacterium]|nr:MAG: oligopeptide ABC transporter ATP-binding protein OppF [Gammaproteobacteria bacterium]